MVQLFLSPRKVWELGYLTFLICAETVGRAIVSACVLIQTAVFVYEVQSATYYVFRYIIFLHKKEQPGTWILFIDMPPTSCGNLLVYSLSFSSINEVIWLNHDCSTFLMSINTLFSSSSSMKSCCKAQIKHWSYYAWNKIV